jgi:hypothetical protein
MTSPILKAKYANDIFTTEPEAISRSMDMGLDGVTHVSDYNGQAVFMPAESHEAYLAYYSDDSDYQVGSLPNDEEVPMVDRLEALRMVVAEILKDSTVKFKSNVFKVDEEQRIIYGWASVTTYKGELLVDRQGDTIKTDTLHRAVNKFMKGVRVGKLLHQGEQVGEIIHSFPMTKEICAALGIQSDKEGWITGYYVSDDNLWEQVKAGDYAEFSIGGRAQKEEF